MTSARILIVDQFEFCHTLKAELLANGFEVDVAEEAASFAAAIDSELPDLAIIASRFSELLGVCRERRLSAVVLTETEEVEREIALLDEGADAVLARSASLRLSVARIKALLRHIKAASLPVHGDVIRFDNFEISQEKFELRLGGKKVEIPPKELQLLYCLASSPNRVFSREQLLEHVWDFAFLGDSRTVDVHIKRLREKLSGVSEKWALKTVWGVGYKFEVYG
ncbi:MAG: response regulator transcription factor [Clostridia bacterium]|nr:response regulator transcription factor [Clostridia bacterium]